MICVVSHSVVQLNMAVPHQVTAKFLFGAVPCMEYFIVPPAGMYTSHQGPQMQSTTSGAAAVLLAKVPGIDHVLNANALTRSKPRQPLDPIMQEVLGVPKKSKVNPIGKTADQLSSAVIPDVVGMIPPVTEA